MSASLTVANAARWQKAKIKPSLASKFSAVATRLLSGKAHYQQVETRTTVPWFVVAVIHEREASQRWDRSIAQGDPWNKISVHVPRGRGPFNSWEEAAYDALMNCAPYAGKWSDWSAGGAMTLLEHYNGLGYANKGRPSPYIWAGTDQYVSGKYVADGVYDPNAIDSQLGCAGMLLAMAALDNEVSFSDRIESVISAVENTAPDDPASDSHAVTPVEDGTPMNDPNIQPETGQSSIDVEVVQKKLIKLGYYEVGIGNGILEGRTTAAIAAFKKDRGIAGLPIIDDELKLALDKNIADGWTRPIADVRANASAKDLAPTIPAVNLSLWQRLGAKIGAGFGGIGALFTGATSYFSNFNDQLQPIKDFFSDVPAWFWFLLVATIAALAWYNANKATDATVKDFNEGRRL